ncbi:MAG TPA: DUF5677 domain-containing protein [Holophagaceae bacterium]|nr:DUF5677 domain-containing protein [Holophagaceae bacterium]
MIAEIPRMHFTICIGLLNRCSRLMLANTRLSHEGLYGETTGIVDRSIFESAVKVSWLCLKGDAESFDRYLADGLKTELELKDQIITAIEKRNGVTLNIEQRMLASIDSHIQDSGLSEGQIREAKKLPDLATMLDNLGEARLMYVVGQKMGSHHVHGTWPSLKFHYLDKSPEGVWSPRDHNCSTHQNQYVHVSLAVLSAMKSFISFCIKPGEDAWPFHFLIDSITAEFLKIVEDSNGSDFDPAPTT